MDFLNSLSDQLNDDDFDPIEILNNAFPDESSLEFLTKISDEITNEIDFVESEIKSNIRQSSKSGESTRSIVENVKTTIDDINERINLLQSQANETEFVVKDVCGSIRKYDCAKHNLTQSITVYKRLQMASTAVTELEMMSKQKNYTECADRLLALTTLLEFFTDFEKNDILTDIYDKFEKLKRQIHNQLSSDFESKLFGQTVDPAITNACKAVDAFGPTYRTEIIEMFCTRFLDGYSETFSNSNLSEIDRRYNWLKQRIDFYNLEYAKIFPAEWRVRYYLSRIFCVETKIQIRDLLARKKPTLKEFQHGFEQTAKFEHMLSESFGKDESNENKEVVWKPATEFIGIIGEAFAKHTDLYISSERVHLSNLVTRAKNALISRKKRVLIDSDNKLLKSAIELVQSMKISIEKCGAFSVGSAIFDLFFVLKDTIVNYTNAIGAVMPNKIQSDADLQLMCIISNTTFYFSTVVDGLAERIAKAVNEDQKPLVRIDDTKDQLLDSVIRQLKTISAAICDETKPFLDAIISGTWETGDEKTNFKFPFQICAVIEKVVPTIKKWICEENFASLRTIFIPEWISQYFNAAFKCSMPLTNIGTERLSKATTSIKAAMIENFAVGLKNEELHKQLIIKEFYLVENALTVIASPEAAMALIYIELFKKPTKEQFMMIVKSKGLSSSTESKLASNYDAAINKK
ncbi:vacuolar protein sorting-associated protein 53 A [Histomonas meleagridis]|uniref:vacuolar protein sorting-associated protein 53 A n=1 Tax=Histomonas meleagridis TaxID=135588 RepID=UPI003559ADF4|nr:vacuolar protein sorting-associated protein 53 A [Histomonas meleagridis]KAH0805629.1 vacuolar protein sorting-associated protein 53 A [Histomonas meleagridis]